MGSKSQPSVRLATFVLMGAAFVASLDLFVVNVAFDDIARDFRSHGSAASFADLSWVLNAYAVIYAAFLVPLGRLGDRYGRKSGFLLGLVLFTVASAACAVSPGVWTLVAARCVQAVGAAAMTPTSLGLLLSILPAERRVAGVRLWASIGAVAAALGPAVGGMLVQVSWHWVFLINVPVGVALVVVGIRVLPDVRHLDDAPRPDLAGAGLLAVAIGALALGLVQGNEWGWTSVSTAATFAVFVVALGTYGWRSSRHSAPVVDPALLRNRTFAAANVTTVVFSVAFGANLLANVLWLQQVWGYSPIRTGFAVVIGPACVPITATLVQRLAPAAPPRFLVGLGTCVCALGVVLVLTLADSTPNYATSFLPGWIVGGIGVGLTLPTLLSTATSSLPPQQSATGSAVVTMARQVGFVLGVSLLVVVLGAPATTEAAVDAFHQAWTMIAVGFVLAGLVGLWMRTEPADASSDRRAVASVRPGFAAETPR